MSPNPSPPDAVDVLAAADPVAAFDDAHRTGADILLRTSGTAGSARVVRRTTGSWARSFDAVSSLTGIGAGSHVWVPGPLTGSMNLFASVHAHHAGAAVVARAAEASHWVLTPSALRAALDDGEIGEGVTAVVAGDRLDVTLHDRACAAGLRVHHYYGATELSFVAWGPHQDELRVFPDVALSVRDGVLWVRSPYLSSGYAAGDGPFRLDDDGFATVGDRGRLRADGTVRVDGRDDVVVTGGATVHVADVEGSLREAATGAVAVVGVPHPRLGAVVAAVVVREEDAPVLRARARQVLDRAQQPRLWFQLDELPLTPAGKVDRAALVRMLAVSGRLD